MLETEYPGRSLIRRTVKPGLSPGDRLSRRRRRKRLRQRQSWSGRSPTSEDQRRMALGCTSNRPAMIHGAHPSQRPSSRMSIASPRGFSVPTMRYFVTAAAVTSSVVPECLCKSRNTVLFPSHAVNSRTEHFSPIQPSQTTPLPQDPKHLQAARSAGIYPPAS